jgi:hypothetical protein
VPLCSTHHREFNQIGDERVSWTARGMSSFSSVRRTGRCDRPTRWIISIFSEAGYLIPRLPHPRQYLFEQAVFQREVGHQAPHVPHLTMKVLHLTAARDPSRITRQAPLPGFHELRRPVVLEAPGNALPSADLGDAVLATEPLQNDPYLLLGRIVLPGAPGGCPLLSDRASPRLESLSCLMT